MMLFLSKLKKSSAKVVFLLTYDVTLDGDEAMLHDSMNLMSCKSVLMTVISLKMITVRLPSVHTENVNPHGHRVQI